MKHELHCVCLKCHRPILPDKDFGQAVNPDAQNGYRFQCPHCSEYGRRLDTTYIYTAEEVKYHNEIATNPRAYADWNKLCADTGCKP